MGAALELAQDLLELDVVGVAFAGVEIVRAGEKRAVLIQGRDVGGGSADVDAFMQDGGFRLDGGYSVGKCARSSTSRNVMLMRSECRISTRVSLDDFLDAMNRQLSPGFKRTVRLTAGSSWTHR